MLQSEAGYIDARPHIRARSTKPSCNARPDHTLGHFQPRQPRLARGLMSAAGLIAAVRSTDAGSSVSAISRHMQCSKTALLFDHVVCALLEKSSLPCSLDCAE
jgi:hypothetical protein